MEAVRNLRTRRQLKKAHKTTTSSDALTSDLNLEAYTLESPRHSCTSFSILQRSTAYKLCDPKDHDSDGPSPSPQSPEDEIDTPDEANNNTSSNSHNRSQDYDHPMEDQCPKSTSYDPVPTFMSPDTSISDDRPSSSRTASSWPFEGSDDKYDEIKLGDENDEQELNWASRILGNLDRELALDLNLNGIRIKSPSSPINEPNEKGEADNDLLFFNCPPRKEVYTSSHWYTFAVIFLAIYATVMAFVYVVISLIRPSWGFLRTDATVWSPSTATLLCTLVARTIDGAFISIMVVFVGQVLSRRAIASDSRGMTIAEMSMRDWIVQPTMLFTNPRSFRYAGASFLGTISFVAAITAYIYTTATSALVSPVLLYDGAKTKLMYGDVLTSYGDVQYIAANCKTPITTSQDPANSALTCLNIELSGQGYTNLNGFMENWSNEATNGSDLLKWMENRPIPTSNLYQNTTAIGNWVDTQYSDMSQSYLKYGRIINNITMTMPHAGIFAAARHEKNNIDQPVGLAGAGAYEIHAAVPGPTVNVMCVNVEQDELAPLVYTRFPNSEVENNTLGIPDWLVPKYYSEWASSTPWPENDIYGNATVLDDVFRWGEEYGRQRPAFAMYPIVFNTVLDSSRNYTTDSQYILAKSNSTSDYTLCSLRSFLNPNCSTVYDVGSEAGKLTSQCNVLGDRFAYNAVIPNAPTSLSKDWVDVANSLVTSMSLNDGINAANASIARFLTQMIATEPSLSPISPSIAEALAVAAGSTLLLSTLGSPFVHYWDYNQPTLNTAMLGKFSASMSQELYISSYEQQWQKMLYIPLFIMFFGSLLLTCYFVYEFFMIEKRGLVIDYTEPQHLFTLAVNSPPSRLLAGSCAGGPKGRQLDYPWHIREHELSGHMYIQGEETRRERVASCMRRGIVPDSEGGDIQGPGTLERLRGFATTVSFQTMATKRTRSSDMVCEGKSDPYSSRAGSRSASRSDDGDSTVKSLSSAESQLAD